MQAAEIVDDGLRHPVEHDESFLAVFDLLTRNGEDRGFKLRYFHFVFPLEPTHFLLSKSRVHLEQRHAGEVVVQLLK